MAMTINTNIASTSAQRHLNESRRDLDLAMERLASCKLIGNTVHLNRFVRELDLNVGRLPHKNPTEPAIDCDRRLVAQLNDKDMEIWNRAQSLPRFIQ